MLRAFAKIGEQSRLAFNILFLMSRGTVDRSELCASVHLGAAASVCCAAPQAVAKDPPHSGSHSLMHSVILNVVFETALEHLNADLKPHLNT